MAAAAKEGEDWFRRQKELKGWHQGALEGLHALVLGGVWAHSHHAETPAPM